MANDIFTQYTKEQNKKCGRYGYLGATREKISHIEPRDYGMFVLNKKRKRTV